MNTTRYKGISQVPELPGGCWESRVPPISRVQDHLRELTGHKSVGPDEMPPKILREWADVIASPNPNLKLSQSLWGLQLGK